MKIEMAESLVSSWLRHVKGCQIVQTNWTVDYKRSDIYDKTIMEELNSLLKSIRDSFKSPYSIYPNQGLDSIINQAECDVVGYKFNEPNWSTLYGVDVAFHSNGLGYGNANTNVTKIIEKSLRTALCFYAVLKVSKSHPIHIYFVTPKMVSKQKEDAQHALHLLKNLFNKHHYYNINFDILANSNFCTEMRGLLIYLDDSDTNELFMRSLILLGMCEKYKCQTKNGKQSNNSLNEEEAEMKVGELAQTQLRCLLDNKTFDSETLKALQDLQNTKKLFNKLGYPLLTRERSGKYIDRYYSKPLRINEEDYYLCNNWKKEDEKNLNVLTSIDEIKNKLKLK